VLWLLGVDEGSRSVPGADYEEVSNWLARVRAQFDELMPSVKHLNVPWGGSTVVALLFDTDRAPFVVRNPHFGSRPDDPISLEVPWREGTVTRSSSRSDLLSILTPVAALPRMETLFARVTGYLFTPEEDESPPEVQITFEGRVYVVPSDERSLVVPDHRTSMSLSWPGLSDPIWADTTRLSATPGVDSLVSGLATELLIQGPGSFQARAWFKVAPEPPPEGPLSATIVMEPAGHERAVVLEPILHPVVPFANEPGPRFEPWGRWEYAQPDVLRPGSLAGRGHGDT
jgi:hypothetical protein